MLLEFDRRARLGERRLGGLGISVTLVGMLLAASTGIVGATVVTMGLLSLPTMLRRGYSAEISTGTICASGTLGQIIPPSIILVMLGDVMSSAYQQAQVEMGIFSPKTVSVGDLFAGALKLQHLNRITLSEDGKATGEERLLTELDERIRALAQSPEGWLYFSTDSGRVYVMKPVARQ